MRPHTTVSRALELALFMDDKLDGANVWAKITPRSAVSDSFSADRARQLGDVAFLINKSRGGTVCSELQFAARFPGSDEVEGKFVAFDGREIKLLVGLLLATFGAIELREQEGAGTRLDILTGAGRENLHALGGRLFVRGILVVGEGGLASNLLDVFELESRGRMGGSGNTNQAADQDRGSFHCRVRAFFSMHKSMVRRKAVTTRC
jgi:hypothetical protein